MEQVIEEGNKLIAEFMGLNIIGWIGADNEVIGYVFCDEEGCIDIDEFEFYSPNANWDQLMPVVEKIGEMQNQADREFSEAIEDVNLPMFNTSIFCHKEELYKRVVQFIQWFNKQK